MANARLLYLLLLFFGPALVFSNEEVGCVPSITRSGTVKGPICKGALIFEDNFDYMDYSKWSHEVTMAGGGNYEFQIYWQNGSNSYSQDGYLHIVPGKSADSYGSDYLYYGTIDLGSSCTIDWNYGCYRVGSDPYILNPATGARLHTTSKFTFTYGLVEARLKAPAGDWLWPTFWMMPQYSVYGDWPRSGEVDIFEARGNREMFNSAGLNIGAEQYAGTLHWGPDPSANQHWRTHHEWNTPVGQGYNTDFHIFQMEWTTDYIRWTMDYTEIGRVTPPAGGFYELGDLANQGWDNIWAGGTKMAPFDQEMFLILNTAVGGDKYFPDDATYTGNKPWSNGSPTSFKEFWEGRAQWEPSWWNDGSTHYQIDYVRVYAL